MRRLGLLLVATLLAGCAASDEPATQDGDPPAPSDGELHHVWYNLTEPGNFSLRLELTLEKPEGECQVDSALMGTASEHNIHHMLYVEQDGAWSGTLVAYSHDPETYIRIGDGQAISTGGQDGSDWWAIMHFTDPGVERSYAVTVYGFNAAALQDEGSALHVYCEEPIQNVTALGSDDPGVISLYPGPNTVRTDSGIATWSRSHPFTIDGGEGHLHWSMSSGFYGQWTLSGPDLEYEHTMQGTSSTSHRQGLAGEYLLETPLLVGTSHPLTGPSLMAFAYAGLEPLAPELYEQK